MASRHGVIYLLSLLLLQLGSISCIDVPGLSMTVLKRLYSVDPKELILNPTHKQMLNEKLEQIQGINSISCENFDLDKNLTLIPVRKECCMEKFGLNELNSAEYAEFVCENETWNKIMDCILPPIQIFTISALKCTLGDHMDISGISDIVKYMMVHTFPTLMNSFLDFVCDNFGVLNGSGYKLCLSWEFNPMVFRTIEIKINEETQKLCTSQKSLNTEEKARGFGQCLLGKKQDEMSFCRKLASSDLRTVYECLAETDLNDDPKMKEMLKNLLKGIKIELIEQNKNPRLLKIIWEEVCSEESPLSKLFNDGASYEFDDSSSSNNKKETSEDGASVVNQNTGTSLKTEL